MRSILRMPDRFPAVAIRPTLCRVLFPVLLGSALLPHAAPAQPLLVGKLPRPPLDRSGYLYVEYSPNQTRSFWDLSNRTIGAAGDGSGWHGSVGVWVDGMVTVGLEFGETMNPRHNDTDPYTGRVYTNIHRMEYRIRWTHAALRLFQNTEGRFLYYVRAGAGPLIPGFEVDYLDAGVLRHYERVGHHKFSVGYGCGAAVAVLRHGLVGIDLGMLQWFDDDFAPGHQIWGIGRLGLHLAWHF